MTLNVLRAAFVVPAAADFYLSAETVLDLINGTPADMLGSLRFAGVAFAWGVLLLLGLRRPVDRAWILWPTILAIAFVSLSRVPGYAAGELSLATMALVLGLGTIVIALCLLGISYAHRARTNGIA